MTDPASLDRVLTELTGLREDVRVLAAIVMQLDSSHTALLQEMRATHLQIGHMNDRIRKLEEKP